MPNKMDTLLVDTININDVMNEIEKQQIAFFDWIRFGKSISVALSVEIGISK